MNSWLFPLAWPTKPLVRISCAWRSMIPTRGQSLIFSVFTKETKRRGQFWPQPSVHFMHLQEDEGQSTCPHDGNSALLPNFFPPNLKCSRALSPHPTSHLGFHQLHTFIPTAATGWLSRTGPTNWSGSQPERHIYNEKREDGGRMEGKTTWVNAFRSREELFKKLLNI